MTQSLCQRRRFALLGCLLCLSAASSQAQSAVPYAERGTAEKVALVTGSVVGSVAYAPIKAVYAAGGSVAGGLVFLMSAGQSATAAGRIIDRSTGGDWYIHPDHLTGSRRLQFRGSTVGPPPTQW